MALCRRAQRTRVRAVMPAGGGDGGVAWARAATLWYFRLLACAHSGCQSPPRLCAPPCRHLEQWLPVPSGAAGQPVVHNWLRHRDPPFGRNEQRSNGRWAPLPVPHATWRCQVGATQLPQSRPHTRHKCFAVIMFPTIQSLDAAATPHRGKRAAPNAARPAVRSTPVALGNSNDYLLLPAAANPSPSLPCQALWP